MADISHIIWLAFIIFILLWKKWYKNKIMGGDKDRIRVINLIEKRKYKKAIIQLKKNKKWHSDDEAIAFIGDCYYFMGDFKSAIDFYEKSIKINPDLLEALEDCAICLSELNINSEKAFTYLNNAKNAMKKKVNGIEFWSDLHYMHDFKCAIVNLNYGKSSTAIILFNQCKDSYWYGIRKPMSVYFSDAHYYFGVFFRLNHQLENAKMSFQKAVKSGSRDNIFTKRAKEELRKFKLKGNNAVH